MTRNNIKYTPNTCNYCSVWYPWLHKTWSDSHLGRAKRIWYLSPMRAAKVQASLRIRAVSSEPPLLAHTSSESRGTFRRKARSLAPLNGWASAVKICHDGMLEDTNSLDSAHLDYNAVPNSVQNPTSLKTKLKTITPSQTVFRTLPRWKQS